VSVHRTSIEKRSLTSSTTGTPLIYNAEHVDPLGGNKDAALDSLLRLDPHSSQQLIPIIHFFGLLNSLSQDLATSSMDSWHASAETSHRKTPFLWVNPNAADTEKDQVHS
jgi:hypothetical protein